LILTRPSALKGETPRKKTQEGDLTPKALSGMMRFLFLSTLIVAAATASLRRRVVEKAAPPQTESGYESQHCLVPTCRFDT
jgi:hypothetical protein